ncbi:MAG: hypothetical protein Kow0099_17080 [Candidatus Abyssubacteria bacterium]
MRRPKNPLTFIPLLILLSVFICFFLGRGQWAFLSLGLVPLFVIVWELYHVYFSREGRMLREILKHLTFAEREKMNRMKLASGSTCGALLGVTGFFCRKLSSRDSGR